MQVVKHHCSLLPKCKLRIQTMQKQKLDVKASVAEYLDNE